MNMSLMGRKGKTNKEFIKWAFLGKLGSRGKIGGQEITNFKSEMWSLRGAYGCSLVKISLKRRCKCELGFKLIKGHKIKENVFHNMLLCKRDSKSLILLLCFQF